MSAAARRGYNALGLQGFWLTKHEMLRKSAQDDEQNKRTEFPAIPPGFHTVWIPFRTAPRIAVQDARQRISGAAPIPTISMVTIRNGVEKHNPQQSVRPELRPFQQFCQLAT